MSGIEGLYSTYASGEARDPDPPSDEETPEDGAPTAVGTYHAHAELRNRNWEAQKAAEDASSTDTEGGEE